MISPLVQLINFVANLIVLTIVLYIAGFLVVGGKKAKFLDAFVIALLGMIITTIFTVFLTEVPLLKLDGSSITLGAGLGLILSFLAYLFLIRYYYETGWLGAIAVAILAIVVFIVLTAILAAVLAVPFLLFG